MAKTKAEIVQFALDYALRVSQNSPDPYRQVGAALVDMNGEIKSSGYNSCPEHLRKDPAFWADKEGRKPYMIHAEMTTLSNISVSKYDILVVTLKPCEKCMLWCAVKGVHEIWYKDEKPNMELTDKIAEAYGISLNKIQ